MIEKYMRMVKALQDDGEKVNKISEDLRRDPKPFKALQKVEVKAYDSRIIAITIGLLLILCFVGLNLWLIN